ncbi:MAG: Nudix family hydrolase [Pseudomonadales bacterium]|nr:Nudix family hydrolase [Pseudomonadales bacterium]
MTNETEGTKKTIHVVAAVICDGNGRILIAKRPASVHQGGLWEFPGGKVEVGEQAAQALVRELQEELSITATEYRPLIQVHHDYTDKSVFLDVWKVTQFVGDPIGNDGVGAEGQPVQWVPSAELHCWAFPAANAAIVKAAQLPSDYVITPDLGDTDGEDEIASFLQYVSSVLRQGHQLLQLRTKSLGKDVQEIVVLQVLALCRQFNAILMMNSDLSCLLFDQDRDELDVGLHLTGRSLDELNEKPLGYRFVAASCHGIDDIRKAEKLGLDFVTLSPVLNTQSHPDAKVLGWPAFSAVVKEARIPVYSLGGMTTEYKEQAIDLGAQGIASISAYSF